MGCFERFLNWLAIENISQSEKSIIRDLKTIGIIDS
jgi:hypothetical protein